MGLSFCVSGHAETAAPGDWTIGRRGAVLGIRGGWCGNRELLLPDNVGRETR